MNAWSHLPNAHHIDRVLESEKSHPEIWVEAWNAAWDAAEVVAWYAARDAARDAARNADRDAAMNAAWVTDWYAAALIAYDDASKYLDMPSDHLRVWALRSKEPAAILLLPAVIAFERIRKLECV